MRRLLAACVSLRAKILLVSAGTGVALLVLVVSAMRTVYTRAAVARMDASMQRLARLLASDVGREIVALEEEARALAREVRIREQLAAAMVAEGDAEIEPLKELLHHQYQARAFLGDRLFVLDGEGRARFRLRREGAGFFHDPIPAGLAAETRYLRANEAVEPGAGGPATLLFAIGTEILVASSPIEVGDPDSDELAMLVVSRPLAATPVVAMLGVTLGDPVLFLLDGRVVATSLDPRRPGDAARLAALGPAAASAIRSEGAEVTASGERRRLVPAPIRAAGDAAILHGVIAFDLDRELAALAEAERLALTIAGLVLVATVAVSLLLASGIARPIRRLVEATDRIAGGDLDVPPVAARSHDEIGTLARHFNQMAEGLRERARVRGLLDKVVSSEVAGELLRLEKDGRLALGGEVRTISVLFCDLRGFTATTESMTPQQVIRMLNEYLTHLVAPIDREQGVVDKFVGDEIMALFGAPLLQPDHAARAVAAAKGMMAAMREMNAVRTARGERPLACGIGITTGSAVAGLTGTPERLSYTVLGATVNLAARLCSSAKAGQILIADATFEAAGTLDVEPLEPITVKGFSKPIPVYAVRDAATEARA